MSAGEGRHMEWDLVWRSKVIPRGRNSCQYSEQRITSGSGFLSPVKNLNMDCNNPYGQIRSELSNQPVRAHHPSNTQ